MNTFGHTFRISTFGESHGAAVGVVIDGCPAGLELSVKDFKKDLDRRKTGQSSIVSPRKEDDQVEILSGVFEGRTLGTPIALMVRNSNAKSEHYDLLKNTYRPSHADFTYEKKYGIRDHRGGGRASARETVARVLGGVVAKKIFNFQFSIFNGKPIDIVAYVKQVGNVVADIDPDKVTFKQVESNEVRCPDARGAKKMIEHIKEVQKKGDTVGGVVECVVKNVPVGLGEPVFDKLKATLAHAMMSLPATMGVEFGSGFSSLGMFGSEHNDAFEIQNEKRKTKNVKRNSKFEIQNSKLGESMKIKTTTNHSGGIQGGISNGMPIVFRVCFKPVATVFQDQQTLTKQGKKHTLKMYGRHDPCVVPRAVVIVEAMAAVVLADAVLRQRAVRGERFEDWGW
ncbi:MAG: chorismate synthase [Candidatus Altimarinota bacterium]